MAAWHLKDSGPGNRTSIVLFATVLTTPYCFSNTRAKGQLLFSIILTWFFLPLATSQIWVTYLTWWAPEFWILELKHWRQSSFLSDGESDMSTPISMPSLALEHWCGKWLKSKTQCLFPKRLKSALLSCWALATQSMQWSKHEKWLCGVPSLCSGSNVALAFTPKHSSSWLLSHGVPF